MKARERGNARKTNREQEVRTSVWIGLLFVTPGCPPTHPAWPETLGSKSALKGHFPKDSCPFASKPTHTHTKAWPRTPPGGGASGLRLTHPPRDGGWCGYVRVHAHVRVQWQPPDCVWRGRGAGDAVDAGQVWTAPLPQRLHQDLQPLPRVEALWGIQVGVCKQRWEQAVCRRCSVLCHIS